VNATITLPAAVAGETTFALSATPDNPHVKFLLAGVAGEITQITVPGGQKSVSFQILAPQVTTTQPITIKAGDIPVATLNIVVTRAAAEGQTPAPSDDATQVVAGANAVTNAGGGQSNAAALIGVRQYTGNNALSILFNLADAGSFDTKQGNVGAFFLDPNLDRRGLQFHWGHASYTRSLGKDANGQDRVLADGEDDPRDAIGWYVRFGFTNANFQGDVKTGSGSNTVTTPTTVNGWVANTSLGVQWISRAHTIKVEDKSQSFSFGAELGLTSRYLFGDISQSRHGDFRTQALGSGRNSYIGFEASLYVNMGDARPYIRVSNFPYSDSIDGFTGWQAVLGIDVVTTLFSTKHSASNDDKAAGAPAGGSHGPSPARRQPAR